MFLKPQKCDSCPFYSLSKHITPDSIVENSSILILAQNPGENEEKGSLVLNNRGKYSQIEQVRPQPLIGPTGEWLKRDFWPLTRIDYSSVSKANIIKCRPNNTNELPAIGSNKPINGITNKMLKEAIKHCTRNYLKIPINTQYILAMGSISLFHLTGEIKIEREDGDYEREGITDWRGSVIGVDLQEDILLGIKEYYTPMSGTTLFPRLVDVFPVLHIASLFQNPLYYTTTKLDFLKFGKLIRKEWPESIPDIKINELPKTITSTIGFDTEYQVPSNELIMWSLSDLEKRTYVVDAAFSNTFSNIPEELNVITQNGLVDLPHFLPLIPKDKKVKLKLKDCMLAHSVLHTGEPNNLGYILSKYGKLNRHKHLRTARDEQQKYLYVGLDAYTTLHHAWKGLLREFKEDSYSYQEYILRREPLLYIINKFQQKGLRIDQERVALVAGIFDKTLEEIEQKIKDLTGNKDFNISSPKQVSNAIYNNVMETEVLSKKKKSTKKEASIESTEKVEETSKVREVKRKSKKKRSLDELLTTLKDI